MADFSFVSDSSSDDGAVEELLNQAMDHSVLQQIAAINLSSFASDSVLPTHLETRFRSLKSFPSTNARASTLSTNKNSSSSFNSKLPSLRPLTPKSNKNSLSDDENENPFEGNGLESKSGSGSGSSHSKPRCEEEPEPEPEPEPDGKRGSNSKARSGSFLSPSDSSNSSMNYPSPPKKTGCFWCSPKRVSKKKSKEDREMGFGDYWRRNNKEILSDLSVFSAKEQQKMLKMAMKEEQKVNRDAEKIVKWAKQASARMNVSDIEDELSESENHK
ncbi:hypothetical protein RHMOL_Rhmol05G0167900 [Rhododendron molle]|uniref:Uncharacterized protein n=1 Tax=Rhododendron molle TaxID=49168 RepID=A0ACC0NQT3_RHOML|nr:hypothetical protein RHMOL_Rhmol05G0167900 [Rhododendron molle]